MEEVRQHLQAAVATLEGELAKFNQVTSLRDKVNELLQAVENFTSTPTNTTQGQ